jgi:prevent-host-death family protein
MTTISGHPEAHMSISAATFKAECLKLMDKVAKTRQPIVITKHGRPVAQLVPVPVEAQSLFGYMQGTVRFDGDIVAPTGEKWSAGAGDEDHLYEKPAAPRPGKKK